MSRRSKTVNFKVFITVNISQNMNKNNNLWLHEGDVLSRRTTVSNNPSVKVKVMLHLGLIN
jgi:hypothetical protein